MISNDENMRVLVEAWKVMAGRMPGATIEQADGVSTMFGHVPLPFLNFGVLDRPAADVEDLRRMLEIYQQRAAGCSYPSLLTVCEPWAPPDWTSIAAEAGLVPMLAMTGMAAEQLLPPRRPFPALDIRRVIDDAGARDLATVNAHAYGMPPELFDCMSNMLLWQADSCAFVGYVEGRPVSSSAAFPVDGTVYIALVATMPDAQGEGYADAVMRHTIGQGRALMGVTRTTLHATDMGQPVYRAMGFESGARMTVLGPPEH